MTNIAISIGFEQQQYTFIEPPLLKLFDIVIVKEDRRQSEQTFKLIISVSSKDNTTANPFKRATLSKDCEHQSVSILFPPNQDTIIWSFDLPHDENSADVEVFQATISPDSTGFPMFITREGSSFKEILIFVQDAQSKQKNYTCMNKRG